MIIKNFSNYVVEKVGLAMPSIRYTDLLYDKVKSEFLTFLKEQENVLSDDIEIGPDEIKELISNLDEYRRFPVVGIELFIDFKKVDQIKSSEPTDWSVGGAATPFGHKNWKSYSRLSEPIMVNVEHGIILKIDISINVIKGFSSDRIGELEDDIKSTIFHEFNHLYEKYNRFLNIKGKVLDRSLNVALSYADENRWKVKKEIFKYWYKYFLYNIYVSEPYEINARVQELAYYVLKNGFGGIENSRIWKYAIELRDFDTEEFISSLSQIIIRHYGEENVDYIMNRLKRMFLSEYKRILSDEKLPSRINIESLEKMSFESFMKYFENRFNKSGDKFIKKIGKLKSLDEKV